MQQLVKTTFWAFLGITVATAVLVLVGLGYLWFGNSEHTDLPYMAGLLSLMIVEIVGVVFMWAKKSLRYLPSTTLTKTERDTLQFIEQFVSTGTSVTIVSNRASWLSRHNTLIESIASRAREGVRFEVITPTTVESCVRIPLEEAGVAFYVTEEDDPPEARFTLVNAGRSGAEKLAIAKGVYPDHEITVFDSDSGPQIIGLAKDIIRKSKELTGAP